MKLAASEETVKLRLAICRECEHYLRVVNICGVCKCVMPVKARLAMTKCPINKWMRDDGKDSNPKG